MKTIIVVNSKNDWPLKIPDVEIVSAKSYLTERYYGTSKNTRVFNLCRRYSYQSTGYYVSLLAEARGHKPAPNVMTIQDLKSPTIIRSISDEIDELIQKNLSPLKSNKFLLSIYFGKNVTPKYNQLCNALFKLFPSPFLRVNFIKQEENWILNNIKVIPASEIPEEHLTYVFKFATEYFTSGKYTVHHRTMPRYYMAILFNQDDETAPSNTKAINKFIKAANSLKIEAELITKDDYGRLAEFDALFIRETTNVNHHTYRFARKATSEGLVVVDDPESILRCTNKVFLAEVLNRYNIPSPNTLVIHKDNRDNIKSSIKFPVILKEPDSSSSLGVKKADDAESYNLLVDQMLKNSDMIIAQEFLPTDFDWRIGIFDGQPLYACKYFMAKKHWQIIKRDIETGKIDEGDFETYPVEHAPDKAVKLALKAANLIGKGLYGVDIKQSGNKFYVIEINDNPSIDYNVEDRILKNELYLRIMKVFLRRIELQKEGIN